MKITQGILIESCGFFLPTNCNKCIIFSNFLVSSKNPNLALRQPGLTCVWFLQVLFDPVFGKELSFCHNLKFSNFYISAISGYKPLIFQT